MGYELWAHIPASCKIRNQANQEFSERHRRVVYAARMDSNRRPVGGPERPAYVFEKGRVGKPRPSDPGAIPG